MTSALAWFEWAGLLAGFGVVHALWQTLLVGAAIRALNRGTSCGRGEDRVASPRLRYAVSLTLFLGLPVLATLTVVALATGGEVGLASGISPEGTLVGSPSPVAILAPWIGAAWFAGLVVGAVRFVRDAMATRRLRREGVPVEEPILEAVARRARRLGLHRSVAVRFSSEIRAPSVVGPFSPMLLLPPGLSEQLASEELECVLAHELAHIRRRDLVAKAAQRVVAVLLFFHPVARWISREIDRDRELCCDDLVTAAGVPERRYARALAQLALSTHAPPAAGLGASDGDVAVRVRRLMYPDPRVGPSPIAIRSAALVAATLLVAVLPARSLLPTSRMALRTAPAWEARLLADVGGSFEVTATDPRGEFTLAVEDGRAVRASLDGRPVARHRIEQRGSRVTLPAGAAAGSDETFVLRILPTGIEWPARDARPGAGRPTSGHPDQRPVRSNS